MVKEAGNALVVAHEAAGTLLVAQAERASPDQTAIVSPQRRYMEGMDQSSDGNVTLPLELEAQTGDGSSPILTTLALEIGWHQDVRHAQNAACFQRQKSRGAIAWRHARQEIAEAGSQPKGLQRFGSRIGEPYHVGLQCKIVQQPGVANQLLRQFSMTGEPRIRIHEQGKVRLVRP